jgi:hypothetical protein
MCRKFETEEEKVLPFYSSVLTPKDQEEIEAQSLEELSQQEELAKVRAGGCWVVGSISNGSHCTASPSNSTPR